VDVLTVILRLFHILGGVLWVGGAVFTAFFVAPAIGDAGPEGGKVMVAMQKRGLMMWLPIFAFATLIAGFWLYFRNAGLTPNYMSTRVGMTFGTGGALALIAFLFGMTVARPSMEKAATLAASLATAPEPQRAGIMAEVQRLRLRGASMASFVAWVLLAAAAAMAVARYV
jgi:hypothetical protein